MLPILFKNFFFFKFFAYMRYFIPVYINFFFSKSIFLLIIFNMSLVLFSFRLLLNYIFRQSKLFYYFVITFNITKKYLYYYLILIYYIPINFLTLYLYNYFLFLTRFYIFLSKRWFNGIFFLLFLYFYKI